MHQNFFLPLLFLATGCSIDKSIAIINSAPEAYISSHLEGMLLLEGDVVTFRGSASDPNHQSDQLRATWYINNEEHCETTIPDDDGNTTCEWEVHGESVVLILEVKDSLNAVGTTSLTLDITSTETPNVEILTPSSADVFYAEQPIEFSGLATDEEDENSLLSIAWAIDGEMVEEGNPSSDGHISTERVLEQGEHWNEDVFECKGGYH